MKITFQKICISLITVLLVQGLEAQENGALSGLYFDGSEIDESSHVKQQGSESRATGSDVIDSNKLFSDITTPVDRVLTITDIPKGFYIVINEFDKRKQARKFAKELDQQGKTGGIITDQKTGKHFVYLEYLRDKTQAQAAYERLLNEPASSNSLQILEVVHETANAAIEEEPNLTKLVQKADLYFSKMWYAEAAKHYEMALSKGERYYTYEVIKKAADAHYFNTNMVEALKWYELLSERYSGSLSAENLFKYAHALKGNGRYRKARRVMDLYEEKRTQNAEGVDDLTKDFNNEVLAALMDQPKDITLLNLDINTEYSEFSPMFHEPGAMVYAAAVPSKTGKKKYRWNDQPFLDLYSAQINEESSEFQETLKFSSKINTRYHEASVAFTPDGQTMYFTRNNYRKHLGKDANGINHLKIYQSKKIEGEWSEAEELPFNSEEYSTGHPALSPDGRQLYFVSDMPGSIGDTDLFVVDILEDGTYSTPRNLGPEINTDKREMFPFITAGSLYFASDGHVGLGGLDIFKASLSENGFTDLENLGQPINSPLDDFSFIIDEATQNGYLASNRTGGKGSDDIYAFQKLLPEEKNESAIAGIVTDLVTGETMPGALVTLLDENNRKLKELEADDSGGFIFEDLKDGNRYTVIGSHPEYEDFYRVVEPESNSIAEANLELQRLHDMIVVENGIKKLKTDNIYFDFDKSNIRADAAAELDKLVAVMKEYPGMVIGIESHTDSRGSRAYNLQLSDRRAKSTKDYLISQGIAPERIQSAIGYGEDRLLNECDGSVACSSEKHQRNRRSEFIITKM